MKGLLLGPLIDVDVEADLRVQLRQVLQPGHPSTGCFPGVGRHAEESHDVLAPVQVDGVPQGDGLQPAEAGVVLPLHPVLIGAVIQHLLHLPQVAGGRDHIEEVPAGAEDPGKFLGAQGGEHIGQQVYGARGQGEPVYRGHGELPLLQPPGRPAQGKFGDVHPGRGGGAALPGQGLKEGGGVIALAAAAVQQGGGGAVPGGAEGQLAQGIPERGVIAPVQEVGAGGYHGLVISGVLGVLPVGGEQMDIAGGGQVKAVAAGTGIGMVPRRQGSGAQGTAEQTHHRFTSPAIMTNIWANSKRRTAKAARLIYLFFVTAFR